MASSLYNLALDFSKELNYTKAIMARQGDKGITVTVKPFLNGLQMDTSGGTFTLKGTTPSNRYVDNVATSVTSEEVTFSLDGTFMSEAGYYKHCYVEYRKDNQILTTQDIIFFSLGVSDISQGQADEYVSQLEELIRKYNETFDAFMAETKGRVDSLNQQITDLTGQAKTLQDKLDALKEEISKLGNLQVMYSNSIDFGGYDYSGNPNLMANINADSFSQGTGALSVIDDGDEVVVTLDPNHKLQLYKMKSQPALVVGETYNMSVEIMLEDDFTGDPSKIALRYFKMPNWVPALTTPNALTTAKGVWQKLTVTAKMTTAIDNAESWYVTLYNQDANNSLSGRLRLRHAKLEEGSTATPYQPNLLDAPYYLSKVPLGKNIADPTVGFPHNTSEYMVYGGRNTENYIAGQTYTLSMKATKLASQSFAVYIAAGRVKVGDMKPTEGLANTWELTFTVTKQHIDSGVTNYLEIYQYPSATKGAVQIEWLKLEKGNTRTPNISEYKYRGTGMRDSNNPYDYVWDIEPSYVENNLATDIKVAEITGKANNYTDGKVAQVNSNLLTVINTLEKRVSTNSNNILDNTTKIGANTSSINTIRKSMPLFAVYGEGTDLSDVPTGTKLPIGALIATDFAHTASDLPYTISSDGNTLTATRNCVLLFEGSVKLHGNNTIKYAYVKIRKNGSDTNFANVGSSAALNYMTAQAGQYVHTLVTGDKVEFTVALDTAGKLFHTQLLSLKISEIKPV
ncbi:BppU family phage baseplate upper protein [Enterococcus faecium]